MLFADATQIAIGWDGLAALGGLLGSGLAAAAKILVSYLRDRDAAWQAKFDAQCAASNKIAEDGQHLTRELHAENVGRTTTMLAIQKEALGAIGDMRLAIQALTERVNRFDPPTRGRRVPGDQ
jgi:hypothetical protein